LERSWSRISVSKSTSLGPSASASSSGPFRLVVGLDQQKQNERHSEETHQCIDDEPDVDERVADVEAEGGEIRLTKDRRNDRQDDAFEDRVHDRLEVQRKNQTDGDRDDVTLVDEILDSDIMFVMSFF
jgi:hypothetical protein